MGDSAPSYIYDQIFNGGATSTTKEYGLLSISIEEFNKIEQITNKEDLFMFIRKFYPKNEIC